MRQEFFGSLDVTPLEKPPTSGFGSVDVIPCINDYIVTLDRFMGVRKINSPS